jgi:hypothetical protein
MSLEELLPAVERAVDSGAAHCGRNADTGDGAKTATEHGLSEKAAWLTGSTISRAAYDPDTVARRWAR